MGDKPIEPGVTTPCECTNFLIKTHIVVDEACPDLEFQDGYEIVCGDCGRLLRLYVDHEICQFILEDYKPINLT